MGEPPSVIPSAEPTDNFVAQVDNAPPSTTRALPEVNLTATGQCQQGDVGYAIGRATHHSYTVGAARPADAHHREEGLHLPLRGLCIHAGIGVPIAPGQKTSLRTREETPVSVIGSAFVALSRAVERVISSAWHPGGRVTPIIRSGRRREWLGWHYRCRSRPALGTW